MRLSICFGVAAAALLLSSGAASADVEPNKQCFIETWPNGKYLRMWDNAKCPTSNAALGGTSHVTGTFTPSKAAPPKPDCGPGEGGGTPGNGGPSRHGGGKGGAA